MTFLIRLYQLTISPIFSGLGCQCRFYPSCSEFARQSFAQLPFWKAMNLSVRRVLSCRP